MRLRSKTAAGFTLIEMMVVVAMIAILAGIMISVSTTTYGSSPHNVADKISTGFNFCKMRAVSTQRWHRCQVTGSGGTSSLAVYQWSANGMTKPCTSCTCTPPSTNCWQQVQILQLDPLKKVSAWNGSSTVYQTGGATVAQSTSLAFNVDFRPDGQSTGGTVFVTNTQESEKWRVLVYKATGASYARQGW
jgi:prepilin-type N-terminal cleavage/methylation domain-containing protein